MVFPIEHSYLYSKEIYMCNFSIGFTGSPQELINKAKTAVTNAGGNFNGDASQGAFSISTPAGKIGGNYTVSGQNFSVAVSEKPFFVSCGMIEAQLRKYLAETA